LRSSRPEETGTNAADSAGMRQMQTIGDPPAIERYRLESDAWKKLLATGERSDRIQAIALETKSWEDRLAKISSKRA